MVTNLEEAVPSDGSRLQPLHNLNLRRAAWAESLTSPVVFWVPEYLAALCGREAPDFFDWRSDTVTFPVVPPQHFSEVVPLRGEGMLSGFPPASFRRARLDELLSRLHTTREAVNPTLLRARARWLEEAAEHWVFLDDADKADRAFHEALVIRRQLGDLSEIGRAFSDYALALTYAGRLPPARNAAMEAVRIRQDVITAHPADAQWQRDLSVSYERLGDVQQAQGDLAGALASYRQSLTIREKLTQQDPGNAEWQRDLSVSYERLGDVQQAQGDLAGALASYQQSLTIREKLTQQDPGNAQWQRDLSVSYERLGNVQQAQGDLAEALASHRQSLAIREKLTQQDPGNAQWQRDLSVSYSKLGDVQQAQGDLTEALASYRQGLTIAEKLVQQDPGNAQWQRDLSVSYERLGDVRQAQGDFAGALVSYRQGLTIREKLAQQDPGNAQWQADMVTSLIRISSVFDPAQPEGHKVAREALLRAVSIAERIQQTGTFTSHEQKGWADDLKRRLAEFNGPE